MTFTLHTGQFHDFRQPPTIIFSFVLFTDDLC